MGRDQHGSDRPLSEAEVVERIEDTGVSQPADPDRPAARRRHDEGDPTDQVRDTAARASGRDADPDGRPADDA